MILLTWEQGSPRSVPSAKNEAEGNLLRRFSQVRCSFSGAPGSGLKRTPFCLGKPSGGAGAVRTQQVQALLAAPGTPGLRDRNPGARLQGVWGERSGAVLLCLIAAFRAAEAGPKQTKCASVIRQGGIASRSEQPRAPPRTIRLQHANCFNLVSDLPRGSPALRVPWTSAKSN